MSTISGQVSEKRKSGKTRKVKVKASKKKVPAATAAAFMKDFNKLLKKHRIPRG